MEKSGNFLKTDFIVTFFVDDKAISRTMSDVLKNKNNTLYRETLGLPADFTIPFSQDSGETGVSYTFKQGFNDNYNVTLNGCQCNNCSVQNGSYFIFKCKTNDCTLRILLVDTSVVRTGYRKYRLAKETNYYIGRMQINDISYNMSDYVSRDKHAALRTDGNGNAFIEDLKRNVGIYVNNHLVHSRQLKPFDEIFVMGLSIVYMGEFIAVRDLCAESTLPLMTSFEVKTPTNNIADRKYFVSTPRILKSAERDEIEVDAPPSPFTTDKTPAILAIGPSFTMSLVMLVSLVSSITNAISGGGRSTIIASGAMAVGSLLGSIMWPSLLRNYQKKRAISEESYRKNRYLAYIADIEKELISKKERTVRILNDSLYPSPKALCAILDSENNKLRLWERSFEDDDFLVVRMGLGSREFDVQLKTPKQGFQLYEDELRKLPVDLSKKYRTLSNVPLTLDIQNNHTIGIIGSPKNIRVILSEIILNIISLHSYDEVKLVIVAPPKQAHSFDGFKNVPHIWSNDKKVRFFATTQEEVHFIFNKINEIVQEREDLQAKSAIAVQHYVVIVTEPELIEKEALCRYLHDADNKVGITALFAYGNITKLPKACKTIIQSDDNRTGYYIKNKNGNRFIPFTLDTVESSDLLMFAKELSRLPIKRDSRSLGMIDRISFLQMYKAGNVDELDIEGRWDNSNSAKSLAAPIGVMAGGKVFSLDLHEAYHGCHGLVAGTTGSGKSEFLQAFVLSLAINYSPNEIAFVLVDFKGGDMARPFIAKTSSPALPHLAATISNLSGNILYRALVSLDAEIKSRQRIFNESAAALGVDKLDINSYHKYYKGGRLISPLPHLVIIIDEFAQLKTQQPEFLSQLVNVAQVGRSLGIHLILATQKPSGIVDPQIMSNARFKVCLKVADKQDSIDMINKPDSALIKNPGRLYLQVGYDEIYECIQSGYSGADYVPTKTYMPDEEITVEMTDNTANPINSAKIDLSRENSDKTQLEAIVSRIITLGQEKHCAAKPLWLDMLPTKVNLSSLQLGRKGMCTATVGLIDYVRTQEQQPLTIDFVKTGHVGLYGAAGMGKTTFLQTLVYSLVCGYRYTPAELNLYALDFGGRNLGYLAALPHTGGVAFADDENKISEMATVLRELIEERKHIFAEKNCSTFADYRAICKSALPAILVLIDNFASLRDKYINIADEFAEIISNSSTYGVYFVITGSTRNSIHYKITEYISSYFTLKMNDPSNYMDIHNVRPPIIPEDISGRGITVINKEIVEFQTAIALDRENEAERLEAICREYRKLANNWHGYAPVCLGCSGDDSDEVAGDRLQVPRCIPLEPISDDGKNLVIGLSKSGALTYGLTLTKDYKLCVCADELEKLKGFYRQILANLTKYDDRKIIFIDDSNASFKDIVEECSSYRYINQASELELFIDELKPQLNSRLESNDERHERMFIIVAEFNSFFNMITDEQAAFMRKVFHYIDSPKYQICFICGFNVRGDKNNDGLFMSLVVNAENYVLLSETYELASAKIETLPFIANVKPRGCYFFSKEKNVEIRW